MTFYVFTGGKTRCCKCGKRSAYYELVENWECDECFLLKMAANVDKIIKAAVSRLTIKSLPHETHQRNY